MESIFLNRPDNLAAPKHFTINILPDLINKNRNFTTSDKHMAA
jgi:hypothetical protein